MYRISNKTFIDAWNKATSTVNDKEVRIEHTKYKSGNTVTYKESMYYDEDEIEFMLIIRRKIK